MTIGEKIKALRTERFMTQTELAGDHITRNMLSLMESGSAQPSLSTILYIAEKLGVPAGYLLADDEGEYIYKKSMSIARIKRALRGREFALCRELCASIGRAEDDDEIMYILAECALGLGREAFFAGKLKLACEEFDKAAELSSKTAYETSHIVAASAVYGAYMSDISPMLYTDCDIEPSLRTLAVGDPFCRYALTLESLKKGIKDIAYEYSKSEDFLAHHIRAKICMKNGDFANAHRELLQLLNSDENMCAAVMYDAFFELEQCCREIGDFKGAYEYAGAKVMMLERLLGES